MTKRLTVLGAILPILFYSQPCLAQPADDLKALQEEIEALKEGQKRIQKELETIKNFLRRRQAPRPFQPVVISIDDDPFKGDEDAKVTLLDFSDYQ
ncbi:MAG: hypothetical protein ACE5JO_02290 [Candidatus Binatia bacterium]